MNTTLLVSILGAGLLGASVSGIVVNAYWSGKYADLQSANAEHDSEQNRLIQQARAEELHLQMAQQAANVQHAGELAAARANTRVVTRKVTDYVDANPSDPVCRLAPELVQLLNDARARAVPAAADPD